MNAIEELRLIEPKIPVLIAQTRELQKKVRMDSLSSTFHLKFPMNRQIESDISKKYKNRAVNIMGGVQVL